MKNQMFKLPVLLLALLLSSCAATYKPLRPERLNYNAHDVQDGISLSYKYDVLRERGNRRYANKEENKGVRIVAVKVTNNSDSDLIIGRNAAFFSGSTQLFPLEASVAQRMIRQSSASYLPYLLLTFVNLTVTKKDGSKTTQDVYPIGLALGPGITIGNMAVASSANSNLLRDLMVNDLFDKKIKPGETMYGIIGLRGWDYKPLSLVRTAAGIYE